MHFRPAPVKQRVVDRHGDGRVTRHEQAHHQRGQDRADRLG